MNNLHMMASNDSGGETGYESNDSNLTMESPKPEVEHHNGSTPQDVFRPPDPDIKVNFGKIANVSFNVGNLSARPTSCIDPPAGISFENIHQFGENGYTAYAEETHQNKIRAALINRKHAVRWRHVRNLIPKIRDILGERRLRIAANTNNVEAVERLLERGVDPRAADDRKRTALHFAACKGYNEIVKLLLDKGADPNQKDVIGNTPLHLAACTNHIKVVTVLLKAGTNVRSLDNSGRTPLHLAQSKLKLLQIDNSYNSQDLKAAVDQVIDMMQVYLKRSGQEDDAELLNAFQTRLNLTNTKEEVDKSVGDLLSSLSQLTLQTT